MDTFYFFSFLISFFLLFRLYLCFPFQLNMSLDCALWWQPSELFNLCLKHNHVDLSSGPCNARGLLSRPVSSLGVLPLQKGACDEQEAQRCPFGFSRVRGSAEEAGALCGHHHPVHRWPAPSGWVQTCAQCSRWVAESDHRYKMQIAAV